MIQEFLIQSVRQLHDELAEHVLSCYSKDLENLDAFKEILLEKFKSLELAYLYKKEGRLIGFFFAEKSTPFYGNIQFFSISPDWDCFLTEKAIEKNIFKESIIELIPLQDLTLIKAHLLKMGLKENKRQRMALILEENPFSHEDSPLQDNAHRLPLQKEESPFSSEISVEAHKISLDYVGYQELESLEKRIVLEKKVFDGLYGPMIWQATLGIYKDNQLKGYGFCIDVPAWGYDHVAWLFDMSVHPLCQGQGYGKSLLYGIIKAISLLGYPLIGLAVTKSNTVAISLYESSGFEWVDDFSEFIQ